MFESLKIFFGGVESGKVARDSRMAKPDDAVSSMTTSAAIKTNQLRIRWSDPFNTRCSFACVPGMLKSFNMDISMRRLFALGLVEIMISYLAGCSAAYEGQSTFSFGGEKYGIPTRDISVNNMRSDTNFYLDIKGIDEKYRVIYADKAYRKEYPSGIPVIAHISDNRNTDILVLQEAENVIVCTNFDLNYNCGMRIDDGRIRWSILFDKADLGRFKKIRDSAISQINGWKRSAAGVQASHE